MSIKFFKVTIVLFLFFLSEVQAQRQRPDISNSEFQRVEWLKKIAADFISLNKKDTSFERQLKEKKLSKFSEIQFTLGYYHYLKNDYVNSIKYFLQAYQGENTEKSKILISEIYFQLANSYQRLFYLEKSILYYQKLLDFDKLVLRNTNRNRIIMNIGNSYFELKENTKALKYYQEAYNNALIMKDSANIVIGLLNQGATYMEVKNFEKASDFFTRALLLSKNYNIINQTGMCEFNLGELNYSIKNYSESEKYFNAAMQEFRGGSLDRLIPEIYKYFVLLYFDRKNYKQAIEYSGKFQNEAYKYIVQEKLLRSIKSINQVLTQLESNPKARDLLSRNIQMLDTVLFKEIAAKRTLTESLNQLAELESANYKLEKDNIDKQQKLSISYLVNIFIIIFLSIISIALYLLTKAKNKIKKQNSLIKKQMQSIQESNKEARLLLQQKEQQTEEILSQNELLADYQNKLELIIEERTKELSSALLKAQESDNLKAYFLQNISHEIRTPLNAISGFSQLLQDDSKKNTEYIDIINQGVSDLLKIVDNIIVYSKLQASQLPVLNRKISVEKIFQQLNYEAEQINRKYEKKSIHYFSKSELPVDFYINSDSSLIVKILVQLVENAFKYTEQGSIVVKCAGNNKSITFTVKDTGHGIKEENLQYIFQIFRKIEGDKQLFRGTGIGLAMVNKLVEIINGELTFQSEYGKGTTVSVNIPVEN